MRDQGFDHWDDLLHMVLHEHERQLAKWGWQDQDPRWWLTFLVEEVGELAKEMAELAFERDSCREDVAAEAIQVATLALKIAEMYSFDEPDPPI